MSKRAWLRRVLLLAGSSLALGLGFGGCLQNTIQRILVASLI